MQKTVLSQGRLCACIPGCRIHLLCGESMFPNRRQALKFAGLSMACVPGTWLKGESQAPSAERSHATALVTPGLRQAGETSDTRRLQRALDEAQTRGGGTVLIPAGNHVSGTLLLRSNVSVWLDNG